jgi:hypothetical protein
MIRVPALLLLVLCFASAKAQVKPEYLYNTSLPFGTLDIRTKLSATTYYYLEENKTFSFRESAPGIRTNTYADVTSWDSSPYGEGHMRKKNGSSDDFIMNYRLLKPLNYDPNFSDGYPLIVIMHGAVERGNCYYDDCYHGDWTYNPNTNSPPAPTNPDHRLLNNDYHLTQSAREHLAARNLAGTRLPNDPSMPAKAFPGFVLMPQMLNVWDSLSVEDMIRVVLLHVEKYKINPDRVYIHGLSIGGYATYEAIKRAPWLFAAALPMSAVTEAGNIFKHNQQDKVVHIPLWTFQGGLDKDPTPEFTQATVNKFKAAGASIQYTVYPDLAHRVWGRAYAEQNFFSWILAKRKNNIHALHGITQINPNTGVYPKLVLPEGFFAYQWEKDGAVITSATTNKLTVTIAGTYRARFSRKPSPGPTDWNAWSPSIVITTTTPVPPAEEPEEPVDEEPPVEEPGEEEPSEEEPPVEEPVDEEPPVEEPVDEEPVDEPPTEEPEDEEPSEDEPPVEEPVDEEPPVEEPVDEEPVDEPPTEEPEDEEPVDETPVGEEPNEEEPVDETPAEEPEDEEPSEEDPGGSDEPPSEEPGENEEGPETPAEDPDGNPAEQGGDIDDPDLIDKDEDEIDGEDDPITSLANDPLSSISVYPNPTNSANVNLLLHGLSQYYTVSIVDVVGAVRFQNKFATNLQPYRLDNLQLNDGVYILNISDGKNVLSQRLVIQSGR